MVNGIVMTFVLKGIGRAALASAGPAVSHLVLLQHALVLLILDQ